MAYQGSSTTIHHQFIKNKDHCSNSPRKNKLNEQTMNPNKIKEGTFKHGIAAAELTSK